MKVKMTKKEFNEICKANGLDAFTNNDYANMLNILSMYKDARADEEMEMYKEDNKRDWALSLSNLYSEQSNNIYKELVNRGFYKD